jgi:hypothetical protein
MQEALFYGFSLERHVHDDHLLRKIDRFVDLDPHFDEPRAGRGSLTTLPHSEILGPMLPGVVPDFVPVLVED